MRYFHRSGNDNATTIERAYFDADRGCLELALARFADLRNELPADAVLEYAEGIIRKDLVGQGVRALEQFLKAQRIDPRHLFSAFNSAKFARNLSEYSRQSAHARSLAPRDPDLSFFDMVDANLRQGLEYPDLLRNAVAEYQQHASHGDCAAFAELAIGAGDWSRRDELELRKARVQALRELDKAQEQQRSARTEYYPPAERLALQDALAELETILELDPGDPKLWNFKAAWMLLMRRYDEVIVAADRAIQLQLDNYPKPLTNRGWAWFHTGAIDEARKDAQRVLDMVSRLGREYEGDAALARAILEACNATPPGADEKLAVIARQQVSAAGLTAMEFKSKWQWNRRQFDLTKGVAERCRRLSDGWCDGYVTLRAFLRSVARPARRSVSLPP